MARRPRVVMVLTSALGAPRIFGGQAGCLARAGFDATLVAGPAEGVDLAAFGRREGVATVELPLVREPSPLADLRALWSLWRLFRRLRPDLVEAGTPKAGLLGMLAAWLARVPARIYTLHGLRLETARGVRRAALWAAERLAVALATETLCVGSGLLRRARELGLLSRSSGRVLAGGSANGVDVKRFDRAAARAPGPQTIGYVGRLTRDKGIAELVAAFARLRPEFPGLRLLLVGDFEDGDPVPAQTRREIERATDIETTGFVDDPAPYYARIDVAALPSYREGLPNAALEAGAAARPLVAARFCGVEDVVSHGVTGLLVPVGQAAPLAAALADLLRDPEHAERLGQEARRRIARDFAPQAVWRARAQLYRDAILSGGRTQPSAVIARAKASPLR